MPAEIAIDLMVGGRIPQRGTAEVNSGLLNAFPQRGHMVSQALSRVDDNVLIREAQRGNRVAFEELVRQYDQAVLRLALRLTASESDAQDIYQDAFLKAYRNLAGFRFECSFYTWLYRIVTNLCLDHMRKRKVRKEDPTVRATADGPLDRMDAVQEERVDGDPQRHLFSGQVRKRIKEV